MKFGRIVPRPPVEHTMTFTKDEGWAVLMALNDLAKNYPSAADRRTWAQWAKDLERDLRA